MASHDVSVDSEHTSVRGSDQDVGVLEKQAAVTGVTAADDSDKASLHSVGGRINKVTWQHKLISVLLVSLIGFGSHWSSGVTGAMKTALKKVCIS